MYGSIPSFCWYAYFIWLGVQALEMDERMEWSGGENTKKWQDLQIVRGQPPLSILNFYSTF